MKLIPVVECDLNVNSTTAELLLHSPSAAVLWLIVIVRSGKVHGGVSFHGLALLCASQAVHLTIKYTHGSILARPHGSPRCCK